MQKQWLFRIVWVACLAAALVACGGSGGAPAPTAASFPATIAPLATQPASVQTSVAAPVIATATAASAPTSFGTAAALPTAGTAATRAAATGGSSLDVIINAQRAALNTKAFRVRTSITQADGKTSTNIVEMVVPDRIHMTQSSTNELIIIKGEGTFRKTGGTWTKSPVDMSSTVFTQFEPGALEELRQTINLDQIKLLGPQLLEGKPTITYTYTSTLKGMAPGGGDIHGAHKIWIGAVDGLPYRQESEQDSIVTAGGKTKSVTTYEYDPNIKIEKPL